MRKQELVQEYQHVTVVPPIPSDRFPGSPAQKLERPKSAKKTRNEVAAIARNWLKNMAGYGDSVDGNAYGYDAINDSIDELIAEENDAEIAKKEDALTEKYEKMLRQLPPHQQTILMLRAMGKTAKDIGAIFGVSDQTILNYYPEIERALATVRAGNYHKIQLDSLFGDVPDPLRLPRKHPGGRPTGSPNNQNKKKKEVEKILSLLDFWGDE